MNFLKKTKISENKMRLLQITGAVLVCCIFLGVFLYCYLKYGNEIAAIFSDSEHLKLFLSQFHGFDKWVFVAIRAFQTVIKIIPAEPLEIGSGYLYGTLGGMLLCLAGSMIGSFVIIALSRVFGRRLVNVFIPVDKIDSLKFLQNKKRVYETLFFIYLIPGTPKDILTYAASIIDLDMKKFLLVTGIARIPSILVSTWCGEQLISKNYFLAAAAFIITTVLSVVCGAIYNKITSKQDANKSETREDAEQDADNTDH